jgi:hypothetical protein
MNKNINLQGNITIDKEAGKAIGQGINQGMNAIGNVISNKWGVLGAMGLGTAAAQSVVMKSSMPPLAKVAVVFGGMALGGKTYSDLTETSRNESLNNVASNTSSDTINNYVNKFLDDSTLFSPLQNLLSSSEMGDYIMINLIIILMIQIFFKCHLYNDIKLNLSSILGIKLNNTLEYYINKIIMLNKKMSIF